MKIKGIITPNLTPMNPNESIDYEVLVSEINRLIDSGIHGIFPAGTNGEAYALSFEEKVKIFETTVKTVNGRVPVYAGTGCVTTYETIALSKEAERIGVDVLSVITPYFAQLSQEEIYRHFKSVAEAVNIPIILYNIPARTGNHIEVSTALRLSEIPNIMGIKDSSGNFLNILGYIGIKEKKSDFAVLSGNDALILSTLQAGGDGAVAGCSNIYPRIMAEIYNEYTKGNYIAALKNQNSIINLRGLFKYGNPNTIIKKTAQQAGYKVGECRSPFNYVSEDGIKAIDILIEKSKELGIL